MFFSLELLLLYEAAVVSVEHRKDLFHIAEGLGLQTHHLEKLVVVKRVGSFRRESTRSHNVRTLNIDLLQNITMRDELDIKIIIIIKCPQSTGWGFICQDKMTLASVLPANASRAFLMSSALRMLLIAILDGGGKNTERKRKGNRG